jgi:hypothetical protein
MLERFSARFHMTDGKAGGPGETDDSLTGLFDRFGGCTFERGLYRVHDRDSSLRGSQWVNEGYPEFQGKLICFGFDWLGRQFALDPFRGSDPDFDVVMLEPGTGEALEVPVAFSAFHDSGLDEFRDACLAPDFFGDWMAMEQRDLNFSECAGYKVPLFLGGQDTVQNLEVSDMEVYWSLMGGLRMATKHLSPGTSVRGIEIAD